MKHALALIVSLITLFSAVQFCAAYEPRMGSGEKDFAQHAVPQERER